MTQPSIPIVFFGSGPVATASLAKLHLSTIFHVEAVITKPVPSHHRGTAPVIEFCKQNNIKFHTPPSKIELTKFFTEQSFTSQLGIVIDYGIIIEQSVIDYFPLGIINSHFSILPQWRGADPITFSILSGQKTTGVSIMRITAGLDEGPLLVSHPLTIETTDTSETLTTKLINLSHDLLEQHLPPYVAGNLDPQPQTGTPTYSHKLTKQDGLIDWAKPAVVIEREIRAYHEWPKSRGVIGTQNFIIRQASVIPQSGTPGSHITTKTTLVVFCGQDALSIERLQPPNKKEMPIEAFLLGYQV
jgi:methionyl-tRNA formyltransferase